MQAILFDANGVLYHRPRKHRFLAAFLQDQNLPLPAADVLWQAKADLRAQHPGASRDEQYNAVLNACGVIDPQRYAAGRRALAADAETITLYDGVSATLHELRHHGFKIGVVTNSSATTADKLRWLHHAGLRVRWDAFINSHDVGVRKPHPRIYQLALEQCDTHASSALFVGHEIDELRGARAVGCATVMLGHDAPTHADYVIKTIAELLMLPPLQHTP